MRHLVSLIVVLLALPACSYKDLVWDELARAHEYDGKSIDDVKLGRSLHVYSKIGGNISYNKVIAVALVDDSIFLAKEYPILGLTDGLLIPAKEFTYCYRLRSFQKWDTTLWLEGYKAKMVLSDPELDIFRWCQAQQIEVISRDEFREIYPKY